MADWFKFFNDGLDEPGFQYAISEQPLVTSVWLVILSEASKKRSSCIPWRDEDYELFGIARKVNVSPPVFNQCLVLLEKIGYVKRDGETMTIPAWKSVQSDYARGLEKGYYKQKKTRKKLASISEVSRTRGEESRVEENKTPIVPFGDLLQPETIKPWNPDATQLRLNKLYGHRDTKRWNDKMLRAYRNAQPIDQADMDALEAYYAAMRRTPEKNYCRRDLPTLLNNLQGEFDRARNWKPAKCY